jgi:hypothetical protein
MAVVATAAKTGFETAIAVSQTYSSFQVQAVDAAGKVIGTSRALSGSTR